VNPVSGLVVAVNGWSALRVRHAAMGIGPGDGRTECSVGSAGVTVVAGGSFCGHHRRQLAGRIALRQDLNGEVWTVALAQTTANAVRGLDDRVVRQNEAVFGADLDADVAAFAPLVNPPDVDEVNDSGRAVRFALGGMDGSRG
jgi:hypothetical protein